MSDVFAEFDASAVDRCLDDNMIIRAEITAVLAAGKPNVTLDRDQLMRIRRNMAQFAGILEALRDTMQEATDALNKLHEQLQKEV